MTTYFGLVLKHAGTKQIKRVSCCFIILALVVLINHLKSAQETSPNKQENLFQREVLIDQLQNAVVEPEVSENFLDQVFISVKTTKHFHTSRLKVILKTWFLNAAKQTYIFTDTSDPILEVLTNGHMINTGCGSKHTRLDLSCKMGVEYDAYMKTNKKWWCHFDDDNYVNVDRLVAVLKKLDYNDYIYLGQTSTQPFPADYKGRSVNFVFATGGAGVCLSRALANKIAPMTKNGKFSQTSAIIKLPDDCTLGFIITLEANVSLTRSPYFHSHLETLSLIEEEQLADQVTLSYHTNPRNYNVVKLNPDKALFHSSIDPTRIYSLHCLLYPSTPFCFPKNSML